jgi:hypothetical protein
LFGGWLVITNAPTKLGEDEKLFYSDGNVVTIDQIVSERRVIMWLCQPNENEP